MANLRSIKKDIEYLVSEVVSDCYMFIYLNPDKDKKAAIDVINEAVALRNQLFERVNNPDGKENKKLVKAHYKNVINDLLVGVDSLFQKVSAIAK